MQKLEEKSIVIGNDVSVDYDKSIAFGNDINISGSKKWIFNCCNR